MKIAFLDSSYISSGHLLVVDIAHLHVGLVLMKTSLVQSYTNISIPDSNSQVDSFYDDQQPDISPPNHSAAARNCDIDVKYQL
jgi:hypothetical protein